ncbi:DUF4157 domain-containing protein [Kordia sp. YSTF-M3]|uniref:DUF4157 domain-containing protein n=1 Tax=Kordia aestuariivivens TaxID=2759037 RepID=A0ABR7Q6Y9_9FLAO|nr:DUF4157 domain-containing protein [Kordia aestuariivivens]MBC8754325.1 DUF4157 domain-containing protein [Kordia aestuariivivens]
MFAPSSIIRESKHKNNSNSTPFLKGKGNQHSFIPPIIQAKLTIGKSNDKYEKEADQVADKVMRMPTGNQSQTVQRKCNKCNEDKLQMKPLAASLSPIIQRQEVKQDEEEILQMKGNENKSPSAALASSLQKSKGGGQAMDASTQNSMGNSIGADFSKVKIHTNENAVQMNRSLSAKAFTNGNDIYFNSGQYNPKSSGGKHLLAHELAHVVQQKGNKTQPNLIQRYFDATGTKGSAKGKSYRIADDLTAAVRVGYPNHDFYAKAGKAKAANTKLTKVGSGIKLIELSSSFNVSDGTNTKTLKKVAPINFKNFTFGDNMKLIDDCGKSCAVIVGSNKRTALHYDPLTGTNAKTAATSPAFMKAEIMKKLLKRWLKMASTSAAEKVKINATITKANAKMLEVNAAKAAYRAATTTADKKAKIKIYWSKVEAYGDSMMTYYNTLSATKREEVDKYLEINKYASPDVGQGYTMSSGGTNYPGKRTWNFHWGGVVMKSDDKKDTVTLENYAVPGDVENKKWDFAMYGTAAKKGQTFHEQHLGTKQHGDKPTTMTIEKK